LNQQIQKETGKAISAEVLNDSFSRLEITYDPLRAAFTRAATSAYEAGFLGRQMPDLSNMYDLKLLNEVLAEKKKKAIQ
jgi:NitT/TauT family transport system substrate-binding protein